MRTLWLLGLGAALGAAAAPYADAQTHRFLAERTVWAKVTHVEPISTERHIAPALDCAGPRPPQASLETLLRWDLDPACRDRTEAHVHGYRVSYTWDGRHYSIEMQDHPGPRIPLRLRIR